MIGVKNLGKDAVKGRYDGQDYTFEPGVTVAVSEDAARHILGFGADDKTRQLARLGWLSTSNQYSDAVKRLDAFQFLAVDSVNYKEAKADMPTNVREGGTLHLPNKQQPIASK